MTHCPRCGQPRTSADVAAYGESRCEDCSVSRYPRGYSPQRKDAPTAEQLLNEMRRQEPPNE